MSADTITRRQYAMIRLGKGDWLLPSNDASVLWRLCSYVEDGSLERNGREVRGTFWQTWRWDGGFPSPDSISDSLEMDDWTRWLHWAGPFNTRHDAMMDCLAAGAA